MKTKYGKAAVLFVLTLFLSMSIIHLPITVKADPGTLYVGPTRAYLTINAAITAALPGDTIIVDAGTYSETLQITKTLTISANGIVVVQGGAMFATHYGSRQATIYVTGASNVVLNGLDVEGSGLGGGGIKSYAILYESSTGTVQGCTVSPNTVGDMSSTAIAAWDNSILTIQGCTVKNFGRIGIYSNNATLNIRGNTIIGQLYTGEYMVNYGIEIEDYSGPSTAMITNNEIYSCANSYLPNPDWSSAAIIVDMFELLPSTVHIEGNNIHDNFEAIEVVGNSLSYAHYNNIHDNLWGVWTDYGTTFDASYNWWGHSTGPVLDIDVDSVLVGYSHFLTSPFGAQLFIDPTPVNKTPSDSFFDVFVKLSDFTNLMGFDIKLTWDNSLITKTGVDYTTALNALWGSGHWYVAFEDSGTDYYELAASSTSAAASNAGASALFKVTFHIEKSCNFPLATPLHFAIVKLSDNATPVPNPIPATVTDGMYYMSSTMPDITFIVLKYDKTTHAYEPVTLPDHFEYGNDFEVQVYVSHIHDCSPLEDYDLTIDFNPGLATYTSASFVGGIFTTNTAVYTPGTPNVIHVTGNGADWSGELGLLCTLTFHVQFAEAPEHIWNYGRINNFLTFQVWLADATLSFGSHGTIPMSGITTPSALTFEVDFIRGDVDCNGYVSTADISRVAQYYGQPASAKPEYDLNNDGTIDIFDIVTIATNYGYGY